MDIPIEFINHKYIIFTLYTESDELLKERILNRSDGNEFKNWEESVHINKLIKGRKLLPNEYRININTLDMEHIVTDIKLKMGKHISENVYARDEYMEKDYFSYINGYSPEE